MKLELSEKAILRLPLPPVGAGPRDYPDSSVRQLVLTVRPTGSRSWTLRYRHGDGIERRQKRLTIGVWPEMSTEEARELALRARKLLAKGIDPVEWEADQRRVAEEKRKAESELNFARLAERFINRQRDRGRRSWASQARSLGFRVQMVDPITGKPVLTTIQGGLAERWGSRSLASIDRIDVTVVLDELIDAELPQAANMRLSILKSFYSWAVESGYADRSPVDKRRMPADTEARSRVLTDDEIRLYWQATTAEHYPYRQYARLLLLTGQRRCEVAGIRYDELAGDIWQLPGTRTKNGHDHTVPLSTLAQAEIASALRHLCGYVLTSTGNGPVTGFAKLKERLDDHMARSGAAVPDFTLHDLRRTVASGLASLGTPPHIIESILNHRSGAVSGVAAIYNRYDYLAEKREALQRWADHVARIVSAEPQSVSEPSNVVTLQMA